MNTTKNTDNTDWYQRRSSRMNGLAVAQALKEENLVVVSKDALPAEHAQHTPPSWTEKVSDRKAMDSWAELLEKQPQASLSK